MEVETLAWMNLAALKLGERPLLSDTDMALAAEQMRLRHCGAQEGAG